MVGEKVIVMVVTTAVKEGFPEEGTPHAASWPMRRGGTHGLWRSCCCCCCR